MWWPARLRRSCAQLTPPNALHVQAAINEGATLNYAAEDVKAKRDVYTYRAYIALGNYSVVLDEVASDATGALGAVRMLAYYLSDREANQAAAISAAQAWMAVL